jgi:protein-S-isoprenylcysteine O-methyltransferase Ste14
VREGLFARRGQVLFAAFLVLLFARWRSDSTLQFGGLVLWLAGVLLRVAAAFSIGPHTNLPFITGNKLAVTGVYAISRNPMYLGNILICESLIIFANCLPVTLHLAMLFGILLHHHLLVMAEEKYWRANSPEAFGRYAARTPRWLGWANLPEAGCKPTGSWGRAVEAQWRNILYAALAALVIGFAA